MRDLTIEVEFFGGLVEMADGNRRVTMILKEGQTVAQFRAKVAERFPGMKKLLEVCRVAVGEDVVAEDYVLQISGPVAFLPPVSGG